MLEGLVKILGISIILIVFPSVFMFIVGLLAFFFYTLNAAITITFGPYISSTAMAGVVLYYVALIMLLIFMLFYRLIK